MKKPVIGITMNHFDHGRGDVIDNAGFGHSEWSIIYDEYVNRVEEAGGLPVLMPFYEDEENIKSFVETLDGLLVTGGDDVGPWLYGEDVIKESGPINYKRDIQEMALLRCVLKETDLPVLGICRGMQILNVALGGKLEQDNKRLDFWHSGANVPRNNLAHEVFFEEGSKIRAIVGKSSLYTNSYHHQNVKPGFVGEGLVVTGVTHDIEKGREYDMPEVIEMPGDRFVLGVQWHPEWLPQMEEHQAIIKAFVEAAAK